MFLIGIFAIGANISLAAVPSINSATVTNVTENSATLNGIVSANGTTINVWYEDPNGQIVTGSKITGITGDNVPLPPISLTGLSANTAYIYTLVVTDGPNLPTQNISFTTVSAPSTTPTLDSLSPTSGTQGQTLDVALTGTNFASGATSDFGSDITINSTTFNSATSLTANITISGSATTGARNVIVTSGGQTTGSQTFTVNSSGGNGNGNNGGGGGSGSGSGSGSTSYNTPLVITQNGTNITINSSTLNGSVNPNGYATTGWFEYGTSATSLGVSNGLETAHISLGLSNVATALSQNLTNLSSDTTYYFRAVANNTYGTIKGNIFSLKTEGTVIIPTTTPIPSVSITTVQAINKTSISAKLNGIFVNQTGTNAEGYFQYGKISSLGKTTAIKNLGLVSSTSFSQIITNLDPNTIYFFRAVAKNQGTIYNGNILVFKTLKETVIIPTLAENVNENIIVNSLESSLVEDQIDYSNMTTAEFTITNEKENVLIGDEINYIVKLKNITSKDLENIKIIVQLPEEVDFIESNLGTKGDDNTVIFETKNLVPNQIGSITIKGTVNSNAPLNKILVTTAMMSYGIAGTTLTKDEIAYATNNIIEKSTGLEANPLFSIASLPYLLGYFALLLVIMALVIIGRKIYIKNKLNKNTKIITDHINNL